MIKIIIFVRVSTADQSVERQIKELTEFAKVNKWAIIKTITEVGSGAKEMNKRQPIHDLKDAVVRFKADKVLVSEISRLGRTTSESLAIIDYMTKLKVSVYEYTRKLETLNEDGSVNPIAELILSVLASVAKMERAELMNRINSGIRAAKSRGIHCGRPQGSFETNEQFLEKRKPIIKSLKEEKLSIRKISKLYSVSPGTVLKVKSLMG